MIFVERFPYWTSVFNSRTSRDFKVGDRVMNINSTMRAYVPFGARGTVIGRTEDKVMVMFDNQFVGGTDLFQQCEQYRGALISPDFLMNFTEKFMRCVNKNQDLEVIAKFTEKSSSEA